MTRIKIDKNPLSEETREEIHKMAKTIVHDAWTETQTSMHTAPSSFHPPSKEREETRK